VVPFHIFHNLPQFVKRWSIIWVFFPTFHHNLISNAGKKTEEKSSPLEATQIYPIMIPLFEVSVVKKKYLLIESEPARYLLSFLLVVHPKLPTPLAMHFITIKCKSSQFFNLEFCKYSYAFLHDTE